MFMPTPYSCRIQTSLTPIEPIEPIKLESKLYIFR